MVTIPCKQVRTVAAATVVNAIGDRNERAAQVSGVATAARVVAVAPVTMTITAVAVVATTAMAVAAAAAADAAGKHVRLLLPPPPLFFSFSKFFCSLLFIYLVLLYILYI